MKITTINTKHCAVVHDGDVEVFVHLPEAMGHGGNGNVIFKIKDGFIDLATISYVFTSLAEADRFAETLKGVVGVLENMSEDIKADKASFAMRETTKMIEEKAKTDFGFIGEAHD